jgi:hypothetical protein
MIDPYQKQTLDEEEQKSLRSMLRALQPFRELPHDMPLQYVVTFLWVAVNEGLGVTDYAQRAGVAQSVMTRLGAASRGIVRGCLRLGRCHAACGPAHL